jgi:membrane-associated phospholipid phosphatase
MPALTRRLALFGLLAAVFVAYTALVAAGLTGGLDGAVAKALQPTWQPALGAILYAFSVLGGLEATAALAVGTAAFLWRRGGRADVLALAAYPAALLLGLAYKRLLFHPGPPRSLSHTDGPSLTELISTAVANSFPSGHMTRTVLVYGLLGFIVHRLARGWARQAAVPLAVGVAALMAVDRLYLEVHWLSDVIGGALLGGICLLGAIIWLDRPLPEEA